MTSIKTTELFVPYAAPGGTYTVSILLPVLGMLLVGLRIYTRILQRMPLGIDDWLMFPALTTVIGMGITLIIGIHGRAIAYPTPYDPDITPEQQLTAVNPIISLMGKIQYAFLILTIAASGFVKLSITWFYRRLFVTRKGSQFDWATRASIIIVGLWTLTFFFAFIFDCGTHFSSNWGSVADEAYCSKVFNIDDAWVVSGLITDILILCLPLPVIWNLHMKLGRKITVIGILATGSVSIVAAIIKVIVAFEITNSGYNTKVDPDLTVSTILFWSMIEAGLAVIAACLPTLRFLIGKVSLHSMVNSVRSALSLGSMHSQHLLRAAVQPNDVYSGLDGDGSSTQIVSKTGRTDICVTGDIESTKAVDEKNRVTKEIFKRYSDV